jgi:peptide/nickel transport system substrate-binding protein
VLRKNEKIKVVILDPNGGVTVMRPNHLQPPFNKPEIRRAFLWAIDQVAFMQAIVGDKPDAYTTPLGFFCPRTPMYTEVGLEPFKGPRDYEKVKESLKRAGYAGERVVLMCGANIVEMHATGDMLADTMKKVGFNLDFQTMDGAAMLAKRQKKDAIDQGGWSAFTTGWAGTNQLDPAAHFGLRGNGDSPSSWPGWCVSPELERLRNAWFDAASLAEAQEVCRQIQLQAMQDVPCIPLGQFREPTAYRTNITGVNNGFAAFWNVRPA